MRPVTYVEELRPAIQDRVRRRYADDARALHALGFGDLCCYTELLGDYSLLASLPRLVLMRLNGEVLSWHSRLQAGATFLLLRHGEPQTIVVPLGLGLKFYTGFSDGVLLITASFASVIIPERDAHVMKYGKKGSMVDTWRRHQERVETMSEGRTFRSTDTLADFVAMAQQEETAVEAG
jgi:hypothetical protein